jgi:hypothetical protein
MTNLHDTAGRVPAGFLDIEGKGWRQHGLHTVNIDLVLQAHISKVGFWIAKLIVKARETQKEHFGSDPRLKDKKLKGEACKAVKNRIKGSIQWELYNWVILQPEDRSSKLPRNSRVPIFQLGNYI